MLGKREHKDIEQHQGKSDEKILKDMDRSMRNYFRENTEIKVSTITKIAYFNVRSES